MRFKNAGVAVCLFAAVGLALHAPAQSGDFLKAPVLHKKLLVSLDGDQTKLQWKDETGTPREIGKDGTFLAPATLPVEFENFNPLKVSVKVSEKDVDDPAIAAITAFAEALGGVGKVTVGHFASAHFRQLPPSECSGALDHAVNGAETQVGISRGLYDNWAEQIKNATTVRVAEVKAVQDEMSKSAIELSNCRVQLRAAFDDSATQSNSNVEPAVRIALRAQSALTQLGSLATLLQKLSSSLTPFVDPCNWDGINFKVRNVEPKFWKERQLTITVTPIASAESPEDSAHFLELKPPVTATFTIERNWVLYPTKGAGVVIGSVSHPKYLAEKNAAGQLAVTFYKNVTDSVSGAVTLNLVAHPSIKHSVAPFIQLGASSAGSPVALLFGGGARLFSLGKGDFGIGGGLMLGWYKDLDKLKPGDVITVSQELDDDLAIKGPKRVPYLSIQYAF